MRYLVTMTIDIEEVPKTAPVKKSVAPVPPEDPKPTPTHSLDQLAYGIKEAARVLGIGPTSIYYLMKDGQLPFVKLGRRTLIPVRELQLLLERSRSR